MTDLWKQVILNPSIDGHVGKPDLLPFQYLPFHIGSKIPISTSRSENGELLGAPLNLFNSI
jgi:hypothetical protein